MAADARAGSALQRVVRKHGGQDERTAGRNGMRLPRRKVREEARRLYLGGEMSTNAEIAARLKVKPHTVARWRKEEDWDGLRLKIDRRAGELFVEKIATDRVTLNVRHYRLWDLILGNLMECLKTNKVLDVREMERIAGVLDRAQKGQRLAKGLSTIGETEEGIRAQSQAEVRKLIDTFIDAVKDNVPDEQTRDRIRKALMESLPDSSDVEDGEAA